MKSTAFWLLAIGVCISTATAEERRRHYRITSASPESPVLYNVTEIVSANARSPGRRLYLLQDSNGDRLVLTETVDPRRDEMTREIRDLGTNEYVRSTVPHAGKAALDPGEESARLRVELNGVVVLTTRKEASSREWRETRSKLRRAAGPAFLERLERMRGIPASAAILSGFCEQLLRFVLYNEECTAKWVVAPARPDCDFDAQFRYPCSDARKKAVKGMTRSGAIDY
jgi:hypothetical protein